MSEPNPKTPRKITLEDLLRLKRHERPGPEYWVRFDRELNERVWRALSAPVTAPRSTLGEFFGRRMRWLTAGVVSALVLGLSWPSHPTIPVSLPAAPVPARLANNFVLQSKPAPMVAPVTVPVATAPVVADAPAEVAPSAEAVAASSNVISVESSGKVPVKVAFTAESPDGARYAADTLSNAVFSTRSRELAY